MGQLRVFLVEDNPAIRTTLIPSLELFTGATVLAWAETEQGAVNWLSTHCRAWNLAVIDLFLAQGTGIEVVRFCRERAAHQRVAVLTNDATDALREECLKAGADRFFDKGVELEDFLQYCASASRG